MRAVFLDKDGTLVEAVPYNVDPAQIRLTRGAATALPRLAGAGFALYVVSNQSGVGRGLFPESSLEPVAARISEDDEARVPIVSRSRPVMERVNVHAMTMPETSASPATPQMIQYARVPSTSATLVTSLASFRPDSMKLLSNAMSCSRKSCAWLRKNLPSPIGRAITRSIPSLSRSSRTSICCSKLIPKCAPFPASPSPKPA